MKKTASHASDQLSKQDDARRQSSIKKSSRSKDGGQSNYRSKDIDSVKP